MPSLIITKNDTAIFEALQEFPCLSLGFLAELLGKKSVTYTHDNGKTETRYEGFRHRLKLLRKAGYIEVVNSVRPRVGQKNRHNVYALTAKARKLLPASKHGMRRSNNPHHDLGAAFIAASFKLGVIADNRLRYLTSEDILDHQYCPAATRHAEHPFSIPVSYWHGKHVETHKKHDWRPFGIELGGRKILFAGIEYDRDQEGNESDDPTRSSIERHLRMILALLDDGYKAHFGTAKFFVPIVTTSQRRMDTMKRLLLDLTDGKGAERILFQVMPDWDVVQAFPKADGHMLTQQWHRAGYSPLHLLDLVETQEKRAAD